MSAGWVAGTVRATALAQRRLDEEEWRELTAAPTARAAVARLAVTPYRHDVAADDDPVRAQRAVGATLLWHLRVLAGWVPRPGAHAVRVLAAGFEVANVDGHLRRLEGRTAEPPYELGALRTAWSRLAATGSPEQLRAALAASPWGDPGAVSAWDVHVAMTLAWAQRVVEVVPVAADWARAAAAVMLLRETLVGGHPLPAGRIGARARRLLGPAFVAELAGAAPSLPRAVGRLPPGIRPLFDAASEPADLWLVEAAWVRRLDDEGSALLRAGRFGPHRVVGAVALLARDAWRTRAALEAVSFAEGSAPAGTSVGEVLDALA